MKKILSIFLVVALVLTMVTGCANSSKGKDSADTTGDTVSTPEATPDEAAETPTVKAPEDTKVVYLALTLEGQYFVILKDLLEKNFTEAGYQFEAYSCDMDALKQLEQLENASANGADLIITWALEPNSLTDACQRAMENGTKIFAFVQDTVARDCFRGTDDTVVGTTIANLAIDWVDKTYADSEDGSVNVVVLGNKDNANNTKRFESIQEGLAANSKINILEAVAIESSTVAAQATAENMFQKYKDIDMFVSSAGEMAIGIISYATSESSPIKDLSKFGVVASEMNEELAQYMRDGIYVGSALNGGRADTNMRMIFEQCVKILNGEEYEEIFPVDVAAVNIDNLADFGF